MNSSTSQNQVKRCLNGITTILFAILFVLTFSIGAKAQITVIPATGGTGITSDSAYNSIYAHPGWKILTGHISLCESSPTAFAPNQTNVTIILQPPSGWQFEPGSGSIGRTSHGSFVGNTYISETDTTITITFSDI